MFDRLWQEARGGDEQRFCAAGADTEQGIAPSCIDWAALSAIAGDHSCSSREMFETARSAPWILQVADVGAQLKEDLARIPVMPSAGATEKPSDIVAQARAQVSRRRRRALSASTRCAPPTSGCYAPIVTTRRARSNYAHFLLARPDTATSASDYAELALRPGADISAIGVYTYFHLSALQKASRLAKEPQLAPPSGCARPRNDGRRGVRPALPAGCVRRRPYHRHPGAILPATGYA